MFQWRVEIERRFWTLIYGWQDNLGKVFLLCGGLSRAVRFARKSLGPGRLADQRDTWSKVQIWKLKLRSPRKSWASGQLDFWQMNAEIQTGYTKHWREQVGGSKKHFKYVEGRIITAEPRLKRDEDEDTSSSMKGLLFVQVRAWLVLPLTLSYPKISLSDSSRNCRWARRFRIPRVRPRLATSWFTVLWHD